MTMAAATRNFLVLLLASLACIQALPALAQSTELSFGVIGHAFGATAGDSALRGAIDESDENNLAFVVVNGIKPAVGPCSDAVYMQRKEILEQAKNGLIVSLAASDWSECKNAGNHSAAVGRLNRLRELFFVEEFSFGASKIPLVRQSNAAKFRNYGENARWEIGDIMFATVNLPANNNHYRPEAGRNSEFEDRQIANRDWLQRVFAFAARKKMAGIVLFCDANPLAEPGSSDRIGTAGRRDGFAETRRQIGSLTARYPGQVLLVHGQAERKPRNPSSIVWRNNLGELGVATGWVKLTANSSLPGLFAVTSAPPQPKNGN